MKVPGCLVAMAVASSVSGCGGSDHSVSGTPGRHQQPHRAVSPKLALLLPASTGGPTTCTVYEAGYGTQVVFGSESLNVTGECQAWTSRQPGAGYLWSYQPTDVLIASSAITACDLRDPSGRVTATVIDETGFAPVSALERKHTASACTNLSGAGWVRVPGARGAHPVS